MREKRVEGVEGGWKRFEPLLECPVAFVWSPGHEVP
jgi:hypothetical protein